MMKPTVNVMSIFTRDDGTQFVMQAYRKLVTDARKGFFNRLVRNTAKQHGRFIRILPKSSNKYEIIFSHEPGYLLGESIHRYFNGARNLIFCEELRDNEKILVVIVYMGIVSLDMLIPASELQNAIVPFIHNKDSFHIFTSGNVPLKKNKTVNGFNLPSTQIILFETLDKPLLPRLPILKSLQLHPLRKRFLKSLLTTLNSLFGVANMKIKKYQIIILVLTGAAAVVLGWEIYMFIINYPGPALATTQHQIQKHEGTQSLSSQIIGHKQYMNPQTIADLPKAIIKQKEYVDLLNQFQIGEMQLRLINQELAILTARYHIALLEARMKELTSKNKGNVNQSEISLILNTTQDKADKKLNVLKNSINVSDQQINPKNGVKLSTYTLDEISILDLPPDNYTITLEGSYNKSDLEIFAQKNNLGTQAIYYSVQKGKKPWFILLYSHYNTKAEAESALQGITQTPMQSKSEIKRINEIQWDIKNKTTSSDFSTK